MLQQWMEKVEQFVLAADSLYHFSPNLLFLIRGMNILSVIVCADLCT